MEEKKNIEYDRIFRALGDKHRLQILDLLMERDMNAGELLELVDVVQSTLSHHMKALCDSGLVIPRRERKWTYYTVSAQSVELAREFLKRYLAAETTDEVPADVKEETVAENQTEEVTGEVPADEADEVITLYANMKSSKKKKSEKRKKDSDKKKGSGKKKDKKLEEKKESDKKKAVKKETGKKKEKKGSKKEKAAEE